MKVSIELEYQKSAMHPGIGFQGCFPYGTTYEDLVKVFGAPIRSSREKTKVIWAGFMNGVPFEIYDYKANKEPKDILDWHIGGHTKSVVDFVTLYFEAAKKEIKEEN